MQQDDERTRPIIPAGLAFGHEEAGRFCVGSEPELLLALFERTLRREGQRSAKQRSESGQEARCAKRMSFNQHHDTVPQTICVEKPEGDPYQTLS